MGRNSAWREERTRDADDLAMVRKHFGDLA
jgi:hypothetical protein